MTQTQYLITLSVQLLVVIVLIKWTIDFYKHKDQIEKEIVDEIERSKQRFK